MPFNCNLCGKKFRQKNYLNGHIKAKRCQSGTNRAISHEFKIPDIPEISKKTIPKSKEISRKRKRKNLKIQARQVINRVLHYHFNEKNTDGSVTERWLPVFEVEDFEDVLEFEKFMAKVEIGSEEDIFKPQPEFFFC